MNASQTGGNAPAAVPERDWQRTVLDAARAFGWAAYHTHDSRRSAPGFPDLVLARPPRLLFVELKTETGRVAPAQQAWLDTLAACGAQVAVWRPSDWPLVEAILRPDPEAAA